MGDARRRLWVATGNAGKVREIAALLAGLGLHVAKLPADHGITFPEEGDDYEANAIAKARAVVDAFGEPAIADDSGIEVDALGGRPGPRSARYGGAGLDDAGRVALMLSELKDVPEADRGARFYCVAALALPGGEAFASVGVCEGRILTERRGAGGFGYDPIFMPAGHRVAMAELAQAEKDAISHRGQAVRGLVARLERSVVAPA